MTAAAAPTAARPARADARAAFVFVAPRLSRDARGRVYSDADATELALLGVRRVYHATAAEMFGGGVARLLHGQCHVPAEGLRLPGVAVVSRQAFEAALWRFRREPLRIGMERAALLRRLLFDVTRPYRVAFDPERDLYLFSSHESPRADAGAGSAAALAR